MGLLDKLWDDTLAGPRPESGLGRLRKPAPLSFRSDSFKDELADGGRYYGDDLTDISPRVTRSIMIKRPSGCPSPAGGTPPPSPADSTHPISPFARGKEWNRFRRYSSSDANEGGAGRGLVKTRSSPYEV